MIYLGLRLMDYWISKENKLFYSVNILFNEVLRVYEGIW